jgi:hypothetical protein
MFEILKALLHRSYLTDKVEMLSEVRLTQARNGNRGSEGEAHYITSRRSGILKKLMYG